MDEVKPQVHEIELPSKKRIILLAEGRLVNLVVQQVIKLCNECIISNQV